MTAQGEDILAFLAEAIQKRELATTSLYGPQVWDHADWDQLKDTPHLAQHHDCDGQHDGPPVCMACRDYAGDPLDAPCLTVRLLAEGYGWTECGWNPIEMTPHCDFDPECPTHGKTEGER